MSRRTVRGFTDQQVPKEVLERVLSAAVWAVRIEPPALARLRAGRLVVGRDQEARRRAPGRGHPQG
ncbi:nitroreductase family protein [Streptomyces sp. NPDC007095]|uniref:nitroreductase family protein n=1 Tax=Streptomyces sp. NPDC007095 TaxID=3154482 RepID=UPI0033F81A00